MTDLAPLLTFKPIDLDTHADLCVRFAIDVHVIGFGSAERFHESDGKGAERHIAWLRQRVALKPGCLVHVWQNGEIIGQLNMSRVESDPTIGYINLLYLVPEARGRGLGVLLEAYAWSFLAQQGCRALRLSASPTNLGALGFYLRNGWQDLGPREDAPFVNLLEKQPDRTVAGQPVIINPDDYLETEFGRVFTEERNRLAWDRCRARLRDELAQKRPGTHLYLVMGVQGSGKSRWVIDNHGRLGASAIVFDAALPARRHRQTLLKIAAEFDVPVIAIFVQVPLALALQRNARRSADKQVPKDAVRSVFAMLEAPSREEGFAWVESVPPQALDVSSQPL